MNTENQIETLNYLAKCGKLTDDKILNHKFFGYFKDNMNDIEIFKKNESLLKYTKNIAWGDSANLLAFLLEKGLNDPEIIKYLVETIKYDVNRDSWHCGNLLMIYMIYQRNNKIQIVQLFIDNGINLDFITGCNNNILHTVCKYNRSLDIIKLLVENGCDINLKNNNGRTPLDTLIYYSDRRNRSYKLCEYRNNEPINNKVDYLEFMMGKKDKKYLLNKISAIDISISINVDELIAKLKRNPIHDYYETKKTINNCNKFLEKFNIISEFTDFVTGSDDDFLEFMLVNERVEDYLEDIMIDHGIFKITKKINKYYKEIDILRKDIQKLREDKKMYADYLVNLELN